MPELSIIVPCRNDAAHLIAELEPVHAVVAHHSISVETLIVDDDSQDGTIKTAVEAAYRFPALHVRVLARRRLQPGLGGVLRYGMAFARGRYCVLLRPAGGDPVDLIPTFMLKLRSGAQLVLCSPEVQSTNARPATEPRLQVMYRNVAAMVLGTGIPRTASAFCGFDRVFVQALGLSCMYRDVCPEMTFKVMLCGGLVEYVSEVPSSKDWPPEPAVPIGGYLYVLLRAALHRAGLRRWF